MLYYSKVLVYNNPMANHNLLTVGNTAAVKLTPNGVHSGMDITLQNVSASGYIYLGTEGVTAENYGYRLQPNHSFSVELSGTDSLYAIASAPNTQLAILKTSLESGS